MNEEIKDIQTEETPAVETQVEETTPETTNDSDGWSAKFEDVDEHNLETNLETQEKEETPVESSLEPLDEVKDDSEIIDIDLESDGTVKEEEKTESNKPDWLVKAEKFHEETGGSLEDFQKINQDFSELDEDKLLAEYLKSQNPDFSDEEIEWEMEEKYGIDEDSDEDSREYKKAILNKKRGLREANAHFESQKEKYATDLKSGQGNIPKEYKEAYNATQAHVEQRKQSKVKFQERTNKVFSEDFKGFDFDTGDGRFRVVENGQKIKEGQSNVESVVRELLGTDGDDFNSLHKGLYAAKNADRIAKHFYQQGKADAIKERAKTSKNIDMSPKTHDPKGGDGTKVKFHNVPDSF